MLEAGVVLGAAPSAKFGVAVVVGAAEDMADSHEVDVGAGAAEVAAHANMTAGMALSGV